jgi:hypothetical protein
MADLTRKIIEKREPEEGARRDEARRDEYQ